MPRAECDAERTGNGYLASHNGEGHAQKHRYQC